MKPPYLKELYVSSSLANCPMLPESEKPKTEIIKVDKSHSEDNTYQVWFKKLRKSGMNNFKYRVPEKLCMLLLAKSVWILLEWWKLVIFSSWFPDFM